MPTAKSERLLEILADEHFNEVVDALGAQMTRIVMSPNTTPEVRATNLAQFHALHALIGAMRGATRGNQT